MAVYKVPQDVEADDKLIGPFSFRQFVYLIIVVMAGAIAWGLSQIFIGLAVIPLPVILLFGALALPLRKDQPMEIYLAAIVSFYIKPHKRLWDPDGIESMIEITAPKAVNEIQTKQLTTEDAEQRFSYLANLVDSQGWAIRGDNSGAQSSLNPDAFLEAQGAQDILDSTTSVAKGFDTMMAQRTEELKAEARAHMFEPAPVIPEPTQATIPAPTTPATTDLFERGSASGLTPYPEFQQAVIQPLNDQAHMYQYQDQLSSGDVGNEMEKLLHQPIEGSAQPQPTTTSDNGVSPDIMSLANNSDVSIETLASEARRLEKKQNDRNAEEVVISLR